MKVYATSRISRRLGERFLFKAYRDISPKSALARRPYPPGMHGKRRSRGLSEFGTELVEKQKIRFQYGLSNAGLKRMVDEASRIRGKTTTQALLEALERRLDNVVYRLGLASSRRIAQHLVSYGFIAVNGKPAKIPSRRISVGDVISIREPKRGKDPVAGLPLKLVKQQVPGWLLLSPENWAGTMKRMPTEEDGLLPVNLSKVIEFYSR